MGFMRKALFLGTGGASGVVVKANSKKERTAKALEKQVRLQKQQMKAGRQTQATPRYNLSCPLCSAAIVAPVGRNIKCPKCRGQINVTAPSPSGSGQPDAPLEQLRKLGELRDAGVVTAEEFEAKKVQLLGRI